MRKTKKGVAKRFKLTASGKLKHARPGKNHFKRTRTIKQKRALRQNHVLAGAIANRLKQALSAA